jgi:hypothetical protein
MSGKFGMGAISVEVTPVEVTSVEENSREWVPHIRLITNPPAFRIHGKNFASPVFNFVVYLQQWLCIKIVIYWRVSGVESCRIIELSPSFFASFIWLYWLGLIPFLNDQETIFSFPVWNGIFNWVSLTTGISQWLRFRLEVSELFFFVLSSQSQQSHHFLRDLVLEFYLVYSVNWSSLLFSSPASGVITHQPWTHLFFNWQSLLRKLSTMCLYPDLTTKDILSIDVRGLSKSNSYT